jgi:hypothetical protein
MKTKYAGEGDAMASVVLKTELLKRHADASPIFE